MIETTDVMTDRPNSASVDPPDYDPVSLVLDGIRLSGATCFSLRYRGSCACTTPTPHEHPPTYQFERQQVVLFHIISRGAGTCLAFDQEMPIAAGDLIIFPFGDVHVLAGGEPVEPVHVMAALPNFPWPPTPRFTLGDGDETLCFICGVLYFEGLAFNPLFGSLPRVIHIPSAQQNSSDWVSSSMELIVREFDQPVSGGISMSKRLAEVLFVALLRRLLVEAANHKSGWLAAVADRRVGHALAHIHTDPAARWTVEKLARACGTSRSRLAEGFRKMVGMGPMEYLLRWRLELTRRSLQNGNVTVAQAAYDAGYNSEPAFSRAFKRVFGVAPGSLRRAAPLVAAEIGAKGKR